MLLRTLLTRCAYISILSVLMTLNLPFAYAGQPDPAPLPDDVVLKILGNVKSHQDPTAKRLRRHLEETAEILEQTETEQPDSTESDAPYALRSDKRVRIAAKLNEFLSTREEVRSRFAEIRLKLVELSLVDKVEAWDTLKGNVEERFNRINAVLSELRDSKDSATKKNSLKKARALLHDLHGKVLAHEAVPGGMPSPTFRRAMPAVPSTKPLSRRNPRYASDKPTPASNVYAFLGNTLLAPPATPPEAISCNYTTADLADDGHEIQLTDDIKNLAQKLGYSPVKIYKYVYENIKYEPYYGSLKGAQGTLVAGAGNATDQASLLIALLRASNIPARYVSGQIGIDDLTPQGQNGRGPRWLGAKTYEAAANILTYGNIPSGPDTHNNQTVGIYLDHVWAEACVPYGHYRGLGIDNIGERWIPLDTSVKDKTYQQGIVTNVPFDYSFTSGSYLSARTDQLPHEKYAAQVEEYVKGIAPNYNNNTLQDVAYLGTQVPLKFDILPASPPYIVYSYYNWSNSGTPDTAAVPDSHRYKLYVTVKNGSTSLLATTLTYPDATLKRITLSYAPADSNSQSLWNTWGGDLKSLPAGVVNVKPVLKLEGIGQGTSTGSLALGANHSLILKLDNPEIIGLSGCVNDSGNASDPSDPDPNCVNKTVYTNIASGSYLALQAYAFQASDRLLSERAAGLIAATRVNPAPTPAQPAAYESTTGEFLHLVLLKYLRRTSDSSRNIGELNGVSALDGNSIGLTSSNMKISYLFDLPFTVSPGGLLCDVAGGIASTIKLDTTVWPVDNTPAALLAADTALKNEGWATFKLGNYSSSAFEHYVWQENARLDAVSTVRGLQFASETGIPIITLNSGNIASYNSLMDVGSTATSTLPYKTQITSLVNDGATVTVPRSAIAYTTSYTQTGQPQKWSGAVYMAENQAKGYMYAIISGNLGGGYAFDNPVTIDEVWPPTPEIPATVISSQDPTNSTTLSNGNNNTITTAGDPVNMATGNMYHTERDLNIKGQGGFPIVFERSYNSRNPQDGPLGYGWTHSFNHFLTFYGVEGTPLVAKVSWTDGTGGEKFFTVTPSNGMIPLNSTLTNPAGIFVQFQRLANGTYAIREKNGLTYIFESNSGTTANQSAKLLSIQDRNGNTLNMNYTGSNLTSVTDGLSRPLSLSYTGSHITQIQDWTGRTHKYDYTDGNNNLNSYKNPLAVAGTQNPVTYTYYGSADGTKLNHAMKSYILPRGNSMTYEYYNNGKVFRHYNTLGETNTFTYNEFRRETVQVNERGKTRSFFFDQYGNPTTIVEENGAKRIYTYDYSNSRNVNNRLSKKDPEGYLTSYQYDTNGNVTQITNPSTSTVVFSNFNTFNQPGKIKDARGNYSLYKYDAKGNILQEIRLKSGVGSTVDPVTYTPVASDIVAWTAKTYDSYGNILSARKVRDFASQIANPANLTGPTVEYLYNDTVNNVQGLNAVGITRRGDKNGDGVIDDTEFDTVTLVYDSLGRLKNGIDADWQATQFFYDDVDRVTRSTDRLGNLRDYVYDPNGNPSGQKLELTVNDLPTLADSSSATYDLSDRKLTGTDAGGNVTAFQYDPSGNVVSITNPDNYILSFEYDDNNRVITAYDQELHAVTKTLDLSGKPRTITDPNGNSVTYEYYDSAKDGRLKKVAQPKIQSFTADHAIQYDYDANGNITTVTDIPADGSASRTTTTTYDELNRPVRVVGPSYSDATYGTIRPVTKYGYDILGNMTQVQAGRTDSSGTNPASDVVATQMTYAYDDFGRKIKETDALGKFWTFIYDTNNNNTSMTDAKSQVTGFTWTYGHQLHTRTSTAGDVTYIRNPLGQPVRTNISNPYIVYGYTYDTAHRLDSVTDSRGNKTIYYNYSPGGLLNWVNDSDGYEIDYEYDPVGRLNGIWAPYGDFVTLRYDDGGRLTERWFNTGATTYYTYNADNSLSQVANFAAYDSAGSSNLVSQHDYTYDGIGNRLTHTETVGATTTNYSYLYDALNRLTQVNNGIAAQQENYSYDPLNNWTSKQVGTTSPAITAYVYDAANQLKEIRQNTTSGPLLASMLYDDNGNMYQKTVGTTVTALNYDALNRLSGMGNESYAYDDQYRRIAKTVAGSTTNYLYNGSNIYSEYTNWISPQNIYTQGPGSDNPFIRDDETTTSYFHTDGLGSVISLSDPYSGATIGTQRFDAWGNKLASTGTTSIYGFTGREPDNTGLIYYRARYYDPTIGRFTQRDPIGLNGGINQFAYVGGNPVNLTDPSGLIFKGYDPNTLTPNISYVNEINNGSDAGSQSLTNLSGSLPDPSSFSNIDQSGNTLLAGGTFSKNQYEVGGVIYNGNVNSYARAGGGSPSQLTAGQAFEAEQLSALNATKNSNVWRPSVEQVESSAFRVIVGEPKYTSTGLLRGTILDSTNNGLLEIKGGTSVLDSSYQLRMQTYRAVTEGNTLTIQSTRPVNPTFENYLLRWGAVIK